SRSTPTGPAGGFRPCPSTARGSPPSPTPSPSRSPSAGSPSDGAVPGALETHEAEPGTLNAILILMGLLVLSYLGSFLVSGRSVRGVGLPSGVEYTALGYVLGPHALGLVGADNLASFEPVVQVALGWLAFAVGLDFGYAGDRRVRAGSLTVGSLGSILTGAAVAAAAWFTMDRLGVGARPRIASSSPAARAPRARRRRATRSAGSSTGTTRAGRLRTASTRSRTPTTSFP